MDAFGSFSVGVWFPGLEPVLSSVCQNVNGKAHVEIGKFGRARSVPSRVSRRYHRGNECEIKRTPRRSEELVIFRDVRGVFS